MSENLDLVRSIFTAWERGDFSSAEWADPNIEFASPMGVESETAKGLQQMGAAWGRVIDAWSDLRTRAEDYRELDTERVLVLYTFSGHGRLSGLDVAPPWTKGAVMFHVRDGKVTALTIYVDRDRALADIGPER
jgi:ketosteroid isomerase-like protein